MRTKRVYHLANLSPRTCRRLKAAQVWNVFVQVHRQAKMNRFRWHGENDLHVLAKGSFALHSQSVQAVFRGFFGTIETTRKFRKERPEMAHAYPWCEKKF